MLAVALNVKSALLSRFESPQVTAHAPPVLRSRDLEEAAMSLAIRLIVFRLWSETRALLLVGAIVGASLAGIARLVAAAEFRPAAGLVDSATSARSAAAGGSGHRSDGLGRPQRAKGMRWLASCARVELAALLGLIAAAVFVGLLRGTIVTDGLLESKTSGQLDPARVQLLLVTLLVGATVLGSSPTFIRNRVIGLPSELLVPVLGSSHAIYLLRKYWQVFRHAS
jgi:hypothetical protein